MIMSQKYSDRNYNFHFISQEYILFYNNNFDMLKISNNLLS